MAKGTRSHSLTSLQARAKQRHASRGNEGGFTLVELLIVIVILPLVAGALSVALLSVLTEQNTIASKTSNSGDATVLSAVFGKDVQSAQYLTLPPYANSSSPAACGTTSPILSLQWPVSGPTTVVSYAVVTQSGSSRLFRYACQGTNAPTTTVVAHGVQSTLTATVAGSSCSNFSCTAALVAAQSSWASAMGVSGVTLAVQAPEKTQSGTTTYSYSLIAAPRVSSPVSRGGSIPGHAPFLMLGTSSPAVSCTGHDSITVAGTAAINSTGTDVKTTGTASFSASSAYVGASSSSTAYSGSNITPTSPTQTGVSTVDPYAGMPTPVTEPIPNTVTAGSTYNGLSVFSDSNLQTDGPGIYLNAVSINSATTIRSGTYVFQNGLSVSGNGALTGSGGSPVSVLFYSYRGAVSLNGDGTILLTPLSSTTAGAAGITLWMDQGDSSNLTLGGNGASTVISGTVYAPGAQANVGGNGTLDLGSLVSSSVSCNGGGNAGAIRINYGGS
jgi:prepilin-type N-terminal cleavage/methylation domain-containing protein